MGAAGTIIEILHLLAYTLLDRDEPFLQPGPSTSPIGSGPHRSFSS
ncbi:MAG: hypothetical protein P1P77_04825 [Spirochaetaceae bacterium]|nr:hypothetical protein [Spirochaetaceae bacterium]